MSRAELLAYAKRLRDKLDIFTQFGGKVSELERQWERCTTLEDFEKIDFSYFDFDVEEATSLLNSDIRTLEMTPSDIDLELTESGFVPIRKAKKEPPMRAFTIVHLTTTGLGENAVVLAVTTQAGTTYLDVGNAPLEEKALKIHRESGFLKRYAEAAKAKQLVSLESYLSTATFEGLLVLPQGARFVSKFVPNLVANKDTLDTNRLVDLGLASPVANSEKYDETAVVKHWLDALHRGER